MCTCSYVEEYRGRCYIELPCCTSLVPKQRIAWREPGGGSVPLATSAPSSYTVPQKEHLADPSAVAVAADRKSTAIVSKEKEHVFILKFALPRY